MIGSFRITEITAQHLARAAYPLIHAAHRELTLKDWLRRVKSLDSRDGSQGIMAVQAPQGTIVAVFAYAVAISAMPGTDVAAEPQGRTLAVTEMVCCEIPGIDVRGLIEAEMKRLAEQLHCSRVEAVDCSGAPLHTANH